MSSKSTSNVSKKKYESSSQSRLTTYFKPSPEAYVLKNRRERNDPDSHTKKVGVRKRIIKESPSKTVPQTRISPVKRSHEVITKISVSAVEKRKRVTHDSPIRDESSMKKHELIAIDLDSSDRDSNLEEELFSSPLKKLTTAKVAKRPLETSKLPDYSTKKAGLAMRSPNKSSLVRDNIPTRIALEEKKNLNREKRSSVPDDNVDIIFSPVKKLKRTHSGSNSQLDPFKGIEDRPGRKPSIVVLSSSTSNSVLSYNQMKDDNKSKICEIFAEKLDFEGKIDAVQKVKSTTTRNIPEASTSTGNNESSFRQRVTKSKRPAASPDFSKKQKEIVREKATETSGESISKKKSKTRESAVAIVNVDEAITKAKPQADKQAEISKKAVRIVRRSALNTTEENGLSISSKIIVGLEEIHAGAAVAFRETHKDIETLLDLNLDMAVCPNVKKALQISTRNLQNDPHVNFKFFMNRKPASHIEALRSLRVDCYQYPHAVDLHTVIHKILMVKQIACEL